jgi:endonuclease YncB( thermonuclease family)
MIGTRAAVLVRLAGALFLVVASTAAQSAEKRAAGDVIKGEPKVVDAATLDVGSERVRLWGIDAPRSGDWCYRSDRKWKPAAAAAQGLRTCVSGKVVACRIQRWERRWFRLRYIGECWTDDGGDVGECMVRAGWATDYTCYSDGYYQDHETEARNKRAGVWQCDNGAPTKRWGRGGHGALCEKPAYKPQGPGT